jgi:hypothetical protein
MSSILCEAVFLIESCGTANFGSNGGIEVIAQEFIYKS